MDYVYMDVVILCCCMPEFTWFQTVKLIQVIIEYKDPDEDWYDVIEKIQFIIKGENNA